MTPLITLIIYLIIGLVVLTGKLPSINDNTKRELKEIERDEKIAANFKSKGVDLPPQWRTMDSERKFVHTSATLTKVLVVVAWPLFLSS